MGRPLDRERCTQRGICGVIPPATAQRLPDPLKVERHAYVVRAEAPLIDGERLAVERLGGGEVPGVQRHVGKGGGGLRDIGIGGAESAALDAERDAEKRVGGVIPALEVQRVRERREPGGDSRITVAVLGTR
jgi:hypothetical protein